MRALRIIWKRTCQGQRRASGVPVLLVAQRLNLFQHHLPMCPDANRDVLEQALIVEHEQRLAVQLRCCPAGAVACSEGEALGEPEKPCTTEISLHI